jgi:hypothetical protein
MSYLELMLLLLCSGVSAVLHAAPRQSPLATKTEETLSSLIKKYSAPEEKIQIVGTVTKAAGSIVNQLNRQVNGKFAVPFKKASDLYPAELLALAVETTDTQLKELPTILRELSKQYKRFNHRIILLIVHTHDSFLTEAVPSKFLTLMSTVHNTYIYTYFVQQ